MMGAPVGYIEKTHDYYRRLGYPIPDKYARFDSTPFAALDKPLGRCRVGLVATAGVTLVGDDGRPVPMKMMGGEEANVVEIASDTPVERLMSIEEHYDRHATTIDDVNAFFPITHLQDLAKDGTIGSLPPRFQKIFPNYSHRVTMTRDAPEVLAQLRADDVDAALLVPV
jgi:D-proline reductase (dithiol) PrdB